jgi:hypothetical protein
LRSAGSSVGNVALTDRLYPYLRSGRVSRVHGTLSDGAVCSLSTAVGDPEPTLTAARDLRAVAVMRALILTVLLIGFTPSLGLDFAPTPARTGATGPIPAFAHDTFQTMLFAHAQQRLSVIEGFGMQEHRPVKPAH